MWQSLFLFWILPSSLPYLLHAYCMTLIYLYVRRLIKQYLLLLLLSFFLLLLWLFFVIVASTSVARSCNTLTNTNPARYRYSPIHVFDASSYICVSSHSPSHVAGPCLLQVVPQKSQHAISSTRNKSQ